MSHLLEAEMMAGNEIEILKKGFLHSRPTMLANHQMIGDVDENGIVKLEDEKKTIAPYKRAIVGENEVAVKTPTNSTGPHAITYTIPNYQFFEMTGYVEFPSVSISGSSAQDTINSRPYMMFGAYQTVYPYGGCDAGLVYYQEYGGWKLFINTGGQAGWHEGSKVMTQKTVYLDMKFISGGVNLIVRDPNTWGIIEELTAYINPQFNTTPNNIELTREVALAQFVRRDNGDWLREAHWS